MLGEGPRDDRKAVAMMETAEDRGCKDTGALGRPAWWQVPGAVGRLHKEASMRPTVVVSYVVLCGYSIEDSARGVGDLACVVRPDGGAGRSD